MGRTWVLFGFSESIGDQLDAIHANADKLGRVVLNLPIAPEFLEARLSSLKDRVEIVTLEHFEPNDGECYSFGFYNPQKELLVGELKQKFDLKFSNLIHPSAEVSPYATLGNGVLINALSVVPAYAKLADHVRINRVSSIGHGTEVGEYCHIAPGVTIAGECRIGKGTFVGAGACVKDRLSIGPSCVIGTGSVVTRNIPAGVVAFGNPAEVIRNNEDA